MIRPRGGDFLYSDREVEVMKADIRLAKLYGADGLVFGALTEDGHIDKELCLSLVGKTLYLRCKTHTHTNTCTHVPDTEKKSQN
jgi:copper homeostasis protein CutC